MSLYEIYIVPLCINFFLWSCRTYTEIKEAWLNVLDNNHDLEWFVSEINYTIQVIYSFMTNRRMELRELPWMATYGLTPNNSSLSQTFSLVENVQPFFTSYFFEDLFGGKAEMEYTLKYISAMGTRIDPDWLSPLVVIKGFHDGEIIYIAHKGPFSNEYPIEPCSWKKSSVQFLTIEYTHPEMSEAIELKLSPGWWREGNELFTPAFVLRMLEYQSTSFIFDETYKIRLMDMDFNIIELGSDMYIVITVDGYVWKKESVLTQKKESESESESETDFICINEKKNE